MQNVNNDWASISTFEFQLQNRATDKGASSLSVLLLTTQYDLIAFKQTLGNNV